MSKRSDRDAKLAALVSLWEAGGGQRVTRPDGKVVPRSQYEGELIRDLRCLCYEASHEAPEPEPKPEPKKRPIKRAVPTTPAVEVPLGGQNEKPAESKVDPG